MLSAHSDLSGDRSKGANISPGQLFGFASSAALALFGCASVPDAGGSDVTNIAETEHVFELVCRESAQFFAVDPGRARDRVPPGYTVPF